MNQPIPQQGGEPTKPSALKGLIFLIVLIVIAIILSVFVLQNRSVEGPLVPTEAPSPLTVRVQAVEMSQSFELKEQFTGLIVPRQSSSLGFPGGGRVERIFVDVGDRVKKGQTLARLDTRALQAQLRAAEAGVAQAEAAHALTLVTVDRQVQLNQKGHVADQAVDEVLAQADRSKASIDAAAADADLLRVQIDLATITAPYAGTITSRTSDEGAIAAPGQPVLSMAESSVLQAQFGVPVSVAQTLTPGDLTELRVGEHIVSAKLKASTDMISASNRTVTLLFDEIDGAQISSGEVARLMMGRPVDENGFWVPISALTEKERGLWSVYVAREDDDDDWRTVPSAVEILHTDGDKAFVRGTVQADDLIILNGLQRLTPGQSVVPVGPGQTVSSAN